MESDNGRDSDFEEFLRATGRRTKDGKQKRAGRPTRLQEEYKEFKEWKKLRDSGITTRDLSEIILGYTRHGEGRGEGDTERKPIQFLGRILQGLGFKEKDLEKIKLDKVEEKVYDTGKYLAPYILPHMMKPVGYLLGFGFWYLIESIPKVETFTAEEWATMNISEQEAFENVRIEGDKVYAKSTYVYPILHELVFILRQLLEALFETLQEVFGIGKKYSYLEYRKERPWSSMPGSFFLIGYFIWRRKKRKGEI